MTNSKSRPIRILHLGNPTALYGAERWILALVRHLDRTQVESIVGVIRDDAAQAAPLVQAARDLGVRVEVFEAYGRINWSAVAQLRAFVLANDIDLLHTHGYKTDLIGMLAILGTRCRVVSTPHGWSIGAGLKLRIYEAIDRAIFPFFDAVAPLSESMAVQLERLPRVRRRLHLIRNGVDIAEIDASGAVVGELTEWKAAGAFVVGYIGQLIPRKGLDVLLRAFAALPVSRKKLVMVGEGPQRADLEALSVSLGVGDSVVLTGFRPDRLAWLRGFDALVLASRLEGIPRCVMEAMAAGVPVVASDIPGCRDVIEHGRTGLLFPLDDVRALAICLERCLDPMSRARMTEAARDLVVARYSAAAMAREYQDLYAQLLAAPLRRAHVPQAR